MFAQSMSCLSFLADRTTAYLSHGATTAGLAKGQVQNVMNQLELEASIQNKRPASRLENSKAHHSLLEWKTTLNWSYLAHCTVFVATRSPYSTRLYQWRFWSLEQATSGFPTPCWHGSCSDASMKWTHHNLMLCWSSWARWKRLLPPSSSVNLPHHY